MSTDLSERGRSTDFKGSNISRARVVLPQIIAVSIKNMLLIEFGMTLGFPTILIPSLSGSNPAESIRLGVESISWIGSINLICVPLGCIISGPVTHSIGRRRCMQIVTVPFFLSWLLFYFSNASWQIFLALCITGFSGGLLEAPVLTYVAEITQPHLRGILSSTSTMSVTLGSLFQFLLGTFLPWRQVALVNCCLPAVCFLLLCLIPETPVWLLTKNKTVEAKKSLAWLRGWTVVENVEEEFQEISLKILESTTKNIEQRKSVVENVKFLGKRQVYWPLGLVAFSFFLGHFNGTTSLTTYAIAIFAALKAPINEYYATAIMGAVQLLGCVFSVTFIHLLGKRVINFISLLGSGVCFLTVAVYIYTKGIFYLYQEDLHGEQAHHWVPVTFIVLSAFLSFFGIRILPWVLIGEVFPNEYRAKASGVASAIGYVLGFIPNKIFLSLVSSMSLPGLLALYGFVGFLGASVLYFVLPETEGKTLFEISDHFVGLSKMGNNVRRVRQNSSQLIIVKTEEKL